ncbi:hypothetical protein [Pontibacter mucosus]|nr:hypothetical protein [Pontibacter mucosus]
MIYLEGMNAPTFKHATFESAEQEAERLTLQTGYKAYILKAIATVEQVKFSKQFLEQDPQQHEQFKDDLPF